MFPCCKKAGGSIPRPGKPCVAFACSPSVGSSSFLPQTKDVDTKATGSSAVFVGVNVSCLSLHVDPAMSRWLTTPNKTKSVTQNGWNSVIVISIFCEKMRQPIAATAWKERRKQNDVDRWDWQANCGLTASAEHFWTDEMQMKEKPNKTARGQKQSAADELGHFGTGCPESPHETKPSQRHVKTHSQPAVINFQPFLLHSMTFNLNISHFHSAFWWCTRASWLKAKRNMRAGSELERSSTWTAQGKQEERS